jgi:large subunit ribosomal protein L29
MIPMKELRQKTKSELNSILSSLLREQFNLRMQKAVGQLSRPDKVSKIRRDVARVCAMLNELARVK